MADPKYRLKAAQFRKNLLQADFMVAEMRRRAERVAARAEETAPEQTGDYRKSFRVKTRKRGGIHKDRAEGRVESRDPAALVIEFGHFTKPAEGVEEAVVPFRQAGTYVNGHYTLTRALDAAGE